MKKNLAKKKIVIGTANFLQEYGLTRLDTSPEQLLSYLWKHNYKYLDLSIAYGDFFSLLATTKFRWNIQVKLVLNEKSNVIDQLHSLIKSILSKLPNCQINRVMIHNFESHSKTINFYLNSINELLASYNIPSLGISVYELTDTSDFLKDKSEEISLVQFPYNVLDKRFESIFDEKLNFSGVKQARSLFLQGILVNRKLAFDNFPKHKEILYEWFDWCDKNKISPAVQCLNQCYSSNYADEIVLGISSKQHVHTLNLISNFKYTFKSSYTIPLDLLDPRKWRND